MQKYKDYTYILCAYTESRGIKGRGEGHTDRRNN